MAPESVRETNHGRSTRTLSAVLLVVAGILAVVPSTGDAQVVYQRISGEGSSWAATAIDAMRVNLRQSGITVDYNPSGSSAGRKNFLNGTVDFAASDVPFQFEPDDGSAPESPAPGSYAYIPATAGGTANAEAPIGTDPFKVLEAIEAVYSDAGVLVLMQWLAGPAWEHVRYDRQAILAGESWRLVSAHLIHVDFTHLAIGLSHHL